MCNISVITSSWLHVWGVCVCGGVCVCVCLCHGLALKAETYYLQGNADGMEPREQLTSLLRLSLLWLAVPVPGRAFQSWAEE